MAWGRGPWFVPRAIPAGGWRRPWRFPPGRPAQPAPQSLTRSVRAELDMSAAAVINSGGGAYVTLAPDGLTVWDVRLAHVGTTTGPTDSSECKIYRTAVLPHRQLAETSQGGGDGITLLARIRPGDTLVALWSGGNPGDTATLNIAGTVHAMVA
jgi:hypothetical protein